MLTTVNITGVFVGIVVNMHSTYCSYCLILILFAI